MVSNTVGLNLILVNTDVSEHKTIATVTPLNMVPSFVISIILAEDFELQFSPRQLCEIRAIMHVIVLLVIATHWAKLLLLARKNDAFTISAV